MLPAGMAVPFRKRDAESVNSVGLLLIYDLTVMRNFSINNGRSCLVEGVGPHG